MARRTSPKHRGTHARTGSARSRGRHASSYGDGFGRFAGITTLSLLPGAGLIATGRRTVGLLLLLAAALGAGTLAAVALSGNVVDRVLKVAVSPDRLLALAVVALLIGAVWCVTILVTAWRARPERPSPFQGAVGLLLVLALCLAVVAPSAKGAQLAMVQRDLIGSVFNAETGPAASGAAKPDAKQKDPWKGIPRVNLLLLGSDAGADRSGVRTDSMIVASIDTHTGNTVIIGIPRSLQDAPFPASNPLHALWPNGFDCGSACLMNAVWDQAAVTHPDLFKGNPNPGLTTTRDVISEITGLRIDAYTTLDLTGLQKLVDAMGGVVVTVHQKLPIGGGEVSATNHDERPITGWIYPGKQRLSGYKASWFIRSRHSTDDYDRMRRQRCLLGNLVDQVNPIKLVSRYGQLAAVLKSNVKTDIKQDQLQAWVTLVERMKNGKLTSLPLTRNVIDTVHPDFAKIRTYIHDALYTKATPSSHATKASASTGTSTHSPSTAPTSSSDLGATDSTTAQSLSEVC